MLEHAPISAKVDLQIVCNLNYLGTMGNLILLIYNWLSGIGIITFLKKDMVFPFLI